MATTYFHKQLVSILTIAAAALFFLSPSSSAGGQTDPADKTIHHLLEYVARSDLTFIRNSGQYTAREASEHMQKKYEHFRKNIGTPEEFIALCATRSLLSGKPYLVISKQGEKLQTGEWLTAELKEYRDRIAGRSR